MADANKISLFEEIRAYVKSSMMDKAAEAHNRGDLETEAFIMKSMAEIDQEVDRYLQEQYVEGVMSVGDKGHR
jgi:hypothetical protein